MKYGTGKLAMGLLVIFVPQLDGAIDYSKGWLYGATRFVQVYSTRNNKGRTAGEKIFNEFIMRFGFPKKLHHDQGKEFDNKMFTRLHELSDIQSGVQNHPLSSSR